MAPASTPPDSPDHGARLALDLEKAVRAMRRLAAGRFEVVGPLGQDRGGEFAFLGRDPLGRLVVLKRDPVASTRTKAEALQVIDRLDSSVPPPAGSCPVCQAPFADWNPACGSCGADIAGSADELGPGWSGDHLLEAVRNAAEGYEVLGAMPRAAGGAMVYFARDPARGDLVALRLDRGNAPGRREGYTVAATRMMRPKHLYGTVGAEGSGSPSPPDPMRAASWVPGSSADPTPLPTAGAVDKVCPRCGEVFGGGLRFCPKDGSALRARAPAGDLVGQVIAERYHILAKLGEGGMGRVYLAEHMRMGRRCALKVMNPHLLHDPDSVGRFNREAANASRITHPNVAAIYDFGETADDIVYLAMELVEGESLATILAQEGKLPERRAIGICHQIADALGAAHDLEIVHRDLKPDNVMVSRSRAGRDLVKVVDFGIAKATRGGAQTVTRTGFVVGTPAYMSPEQILGDTLDGRSDLYSLGCILYEMLAGERPFAGPSGEVSIHQRLTEPPPNPHHANPQLSRRLGDIVTTAMARSSEQRFRTASAFGEALAAVEREFTEAGSHRRWWAPWSRRRGTQTTPPVSRPGPATNLPADTAPVPLGWTEVAQPMPSPPRHGTTMLRHRSTRPTTRSAWLLGGGGVGGTLLILLLWRLFSPAPQPVIPPPNSSETQAPRPPDAPPEGAVVAPPPGEAETTLASTDGPSAAAISAGAVRLPAALPSGARLTIDGSERALPDGDILELPPGRHAVVVRAPGFRRVTRSVVLTAGDTVVLDFELVAAEPGHRPAPAPMPEPAGTGTVVIDGVLPPGAEVFLDGRPLPSGERVATAVPGMHWLRISALNYRPDSSRVQVEAGSRTVWLAPRLELLPRPKPEPAPKPAPPPEAKPSVVVPPDPSSATAPPPAPPPASEEEARAEIHALLGAYQAAINARSLNRLKALYPAMSSKREAEWRDVFGRGVSDLKAGLSVRSIRPISSAGEGIPWLATFTIQLSFKPDGAKEQSFKIMNTATVNREAGQWRFASLEEVGE
jgi:serine/threonine protein kinase